MELRPPLALQVVPNALVPTPSDKRQGRRGGGRGTFPHCPATALVVLLPSQSVFQNPVPHEGHAATNLVLHKQGTPCNAFAHVLLFSVLVRR